MTENVAAPSAAPSAPAPSALETPGVGPLPGVTIRTWGEKSEPAAVAPPADTQSAPAADVSAVGTHSGDQAPPPVAPQKYVFGGVEFEDQTRAEHSFKTLRGMHASQLRANEQLRLRTLELERDLLHLKNQPKTEVPPTPGAKGQASAAAPNAATEADTYAVFEVLKEKFGPRVAQEWLTEQNDARVEARVEQKLSEALKEIRETIEPLKETHAAAAERQQLVGIFQQLAGYQMPDGSPAYPELQDPRAMHDVGILWKNLGGTVEQMKTPRGVHIAIATYRDAMASRARVSKTTRPSTAPPAPAPNPVVSAGGDSPGQHPRQGAPAKELDEVADRLLNAKVGVDKTLGFRVRQFA